MAAKPIRLALRVAPKDVASTVSLKIPRGYENNVTYLDPDPALHFASNATDSLMTISAFDHEPIITQHLNNYAKELPLIRHNHFSQGAFAKDLFLTHACHRWYDELMTPLY